MAALILALAPGASGMVSGIPASSQGADWIVQPEPERDALIRNPFLGWGIYADAYTPDDTFWEQFDAINAPGAATHLYIRWPWSAFEPEEGIYAWDNDPFLKLLEQGAKERGLKLAFRVYVDSRDFTTQSTPEYVRKAGAKGFSGDTNTGRYSNQWSPYADDPVFQKKYETFLRAFAARYDDPVTVDFVDGFGLGLWGEGHGVILRNPSSYRKTVLWITDLYAEQFKKVPLVINYHSDIGGPLLDTIFRRNDYLLRHDAFGMGDWYRDFEKSVVAKHFPARAVIAESGWWLNGSDWKNNDSNKYETWRDVMARTTDDALKEHANILDLRNIKEATAWMQDGRDLVDRFIREGGYRFYPSEITVPQVVSGSSFPVAHTWENLGVGMAPTNNSRWAAKHKVAFAFLDAEGKPVGEVMVDEQSDPSAWIKGKPAKYRFTAQRSGVPAGEYRLGVALINTEPEGLPGLKLAIRNADANAEWIPLTTVTVK